MPDGYGSQAEYMKQVVPLAEERQREIEEALRKAFAAFIELREVEVVIFSGMRASDLARAIVEHPMILKSLLAASNIAARAIERDLGMRNLDTYRPRITEETAGILAGYIRPFLPASLALPALGHIDRVYFMDKEIRKRKGQWEAKVTLALCDVAKQQFVKRKFTSGGERFELDAAFPKRGDIRVGVDVKRIEARRDIHKRCDEIVNKAAKLKRACQDARFGAVVYYPFVDEQGNIRSRLESEQVDGVVFASDDDQAIRNAARCLLAMLKAPAS